MSTHNIHFCGERRKILCGYRHSPGAMSEYKQDTVVAEGVPLSRTHKISFGISSSSSSNPGQQVRSLCWVNRVCAVYGKSCHEKIYPFQRHI